MRRFSRRLHSTGTVAAIASITAIALLVPTSASAEPIGSIQQLSNFAPADPIEECGSASTAYNSTSGATVAVWAGTTALASASVNIALTGAGGVAGPTVTYQPADATPLAYPEYCDPISVDAGANGGFLVSWNDADTDGAVYGLIVSSTGAVVGNTFTISSNTNYSDIETTSAAWSAADSRFLVTWKARVATPFPAALATQQIVGRFIDGSGAPIGADFLVTDIAEAIDNSQDVTFGGGSWIVVGSGSDDGVVRSVAVSFNGTVSAAVPVPGTSGTGNGPSVQFNASTGQSLIVARSGANVWGQLITPSGALAGAPFVVANSSGSRPRVASLGADGWLTVWHRNGSTDVNGIEVSTAGVPVGAPEIVSAGLNDDTVELNFRPEVSFSSVTGEATVVWTRYIDADDAGNVVARAWAVAAPVALPAAAPTLVVTGVDEDRAALVVGAAGLALITGIAALVIRRRRLAAL